MHVVSFNPVSELAEQIVPAPKPAKEYLPEWYKKFSVPENQKNRSNSQIPDMSLKMCQPFRDSLISGYIQESWQDISFYRDEHGNLTYEFLIDPEMISIRKTPSLPIDETFYSHELLFHPQWAPKMPRGWSMLFTHPLNRIDLPFWVADGIIDSDSFSYFYPKSNIPFYLKSNFEGVIPRGTPLFQMIPIKRDRWISQKKRFNEVRQRVLESKAHSVFSGGYKKEFWKRKFYE